MLTSQGVPALRVLISLRELDPSDRDTWQHMSIERGDSDDETSLSRGKCFYKAARPVTTFLVTDPSNELGSGAMAFHIDDGGKSLQISWPRKINTESVRQLGRFWADVSVSNEPFGTLFDGADVLDFVRRYLSKGRTFTTGFANRPINSANSGIRVAGQTENSRGLIWQYFESGLYARVHSDVSMRETQFTKTRFPRESVRLNI